ncbi:MULTISPECIES: hypothetical protein [Flammeovirga]|uniref:Uncharacterized protein n=1 Tax=Flammeovirga agarivorans TaxID=2726742 RepID=A0A7X8SL75_9BACT|nr:MULTISPECIES: hypothetical protein [Flammeovirga]NLR92289.1 hypothetical protein [Flammeovirga agarivorans]
MKNTLLLISLVIGLNISAVEAVEAGNINKSIRKEVKASLRRKKKQKKQKRRFLNKYYGKSHNGLKHK